MTISRTLHRASGGVVSGVEVQVTPEVWGGPTYTAARAGDSAPLEFHVYDASNTVFLGSLTRFVGRPSWEEELNGTGHGSLIVAASDPAIVANPSILDDDNIVVARMYGQDVFSWRVQSGEDVLVDRGERSDLQFEFSGPGALDALSEAIVRPEHPISGDPTRTSQERFFGYMSKVPPTSFQASDQVTKNLVIHPISEEATDWEWDSGGESSDWTLSLGTSAGENGEDVSVFSVASNSGTSPTFLHTAGTSPLNESVVLSISVRVQSSKSGGVTPLVDFGSSRVSGTMKTVTENEWTDVTFENVSVPSGATEFTVGLTFSSSLHETGTTIKAYEVIAQPGSNSTGFFSGDTTDTVNWLYAWEGADNNSASTKTYAALVTPELQPSWYVPELWKKSYKVVRKDAAKSGTGQFSPEGWPDPTAFLMWPSSPTDPTVPGTVFWRKKFTMVEARSVFVQAAADNQTRVWLDGTEIITSGFNGDATDITGSWEGVLSAGEHIIAAISTNFKSPYQTPSMTQGEDPVFVGNYGWFLCSVMFKVNNEPVGVIAHSDASWECFFEGDASLPRTDRQVTTSTQRSIPVTYTVRSGDTLSAIGAKFGIPWRDIYNANKSQIDSRAARSGLANKGPGWWIFPGQVFTIPGRYTTTGSTTTVTKTEWGAGQPLTTKTPGWYPYQMLARLVQEGKDRGVRALTSLSFGFSFGKDSSGQDWDAGFDAVVERSFRIGSSVLDAAQQLVEGGLDVRMKPGMILCAYKQMGTYRGVNAPTSTRYILLDKGGTTIRYSVKKRSKLYNSLMIDTDNGWRNYTTTGDEEGVSEGSVSLGGMDSANITKVIGSELEELSRRTKTVTVSFLIKPGRRPYVDFDLGDVVVAHDNRGRPFDARITGIGVELRGENDYRCEVSASGEGLTT